MKKANPRLAFAAAISWITAEQHGSETAQLSSAFISTSEGERRTFELWVSIEGAAAPLSCGDVGLLCVPLESTVGLQTHTFIYNNDYK